MTRAIWFVLATVAATAACRSAPTKYYTLIAPAHADDAAGAPGPASAALQVDVLPVDVPPEVDRQQIVIRRGAGELTPVDTRSWIAPLALELRRALADELAHRLGARDVDGMTPTAGLPVYRIKVSVTRFESVLGERAIDEATWSVRDATGAASLTCGARASEPAHGSYAELAVAHQQALGQIAAQIAAAVSAMRGGGEATCEAAHPAHS